MSQDYKLEIEYFNVVLGVSMKKEFKKTQPATRLRF